MTILRWIAALSVIALGTPTLACGVDSDCPLGDRIYRIHVPQDGAKNGAILFAHGYRGSAAGVMRNRSLRGLADRLGVALIAAQGVNGSWQLDNHPSGRGRDEIELTYIDALLADVEQRFDIPADQIMATGFSAGGMMTWTLACHRPDRFKGFAPIAGTFWDPVPPTCDGTASLIHIHGTADRTVPLGGRAIGPGRQGDVPTALDLWTKLGGFTQAEGYDEGNLTCTAQTNPAAQRLEFCTHPGGHSFATEYLRHAWTRLSL